MAGKRVFVLFAAILFLAGALVLSTRTLAVTEKRIPAEWEPQEAIWLQWPGPWERAYEPAFAKFSTIIAGYQKLHILYGNNKIREKARKALEAAGGDPDHRNIRWHEVPSDSAWMRDNGPVYVIEDGEMRLQNWEFDAWGGAFGRDIPYGLDNRVPDAVGNILGMPVDHVDIVHERGNLEFNGDDAVILNWSTIGDPRRNPGYTREQAEADLKKHFGVSKVVFVEGVTEGDLTNGHIDGLARFINKTTVVVPQCTDQSHCKPDDGGDGAVYENAARTIAHAGFDVARLPIETTVSYQGKTLGTNYMNWLVGNGFVITVGFGHEEADNNARALLESFFPGRDVYVVEMLASWYAGGGVHCHTNDQPAMSTIAASP